MADSSEGGTKINRTRNVPQQAPQQMDPRAQQQMDPRMQQQAQQQMDPRAQQQMDPRMQQAQQQAQQQMGPRMQQMDPMVVESINKNRLKSMKRMFENGPLNTSVLKTSILVTLIFVLLNSKMVWKQLIKLPMMGTTDPSILALIVNAILAGIIFYCINITLK